MRNVPWYKHIRGTDGSTYRREFQLTPLTRWGHLCLFLYERGDIDPDPHDHPWDFWTFPLHTYLEQVMNDQDGLMASQMVRRFRWHHRPADYAHRVVGRALCKPWSGPYSVSTRPFATFVWAGPRRRRWGFWPHKERVVQGWPSPQAETALLGDLRRAGRRMWVHWYTYFEASGQ